MTDETQELVGSTVPAPYVQAMVLCDSLTIDLATSKISLMGCFRAVFATEFPTAKANAVLYVVMTNGRGKVPIMIQLVDVDEENAPVKLAEGEIEFIDPISPLELRQPIPMLPFDRPGSYSIQLFAGPEFLMEYRLTAIQLGGQS